MSTSEVIDHKPVTREDGGRMSRLDITERPRRRIRSGESVVGIIGLGYVGLPLAQALHAAGSRIHGLDIGEGKVRALADGENYLKHLGEEMPGALSQGPRFAATSDLSRLGEADVVIVCVPTPLGRHQEPDLAFVINSARAIG